MKYITEDKLVILGAAGAIGSNMAQAALTMRLTPNVCLYDPFEKGLKGAAEEIYHCAFPGARPIPVPSSGSLELGTTLYLH